MTALSSNVLYEKMLSEFNLRPATAIIESANCKSQSKCAAHFSDIQNITDTFNSTIIRTFHIQEHGEGEVDHVGGIAKSAIKREIGTGEILIEVKEMVEFLQ